jgi:O-antigen/teichoic acid export membrane protein
MKKSESNSEADGSMRRPWAGRLIQNALALMVSAGGTAVVGVAFWGIAAHLASPAAVGRTSAEIAAMVLVANLAQLSFGSIFERFLPVAGIQTRTFVRRAYVMCVSFAFVASIVYVSSGLARSFIPSSILWQAFFVVSVVMWTIFILQDSVLVGLRSARWVPVENILYAIAKLALLPLMIAFSASQGLFVAWSVPVSLTIVGVTWYLFTKRIPEHEAAGGPGESLPQTRELVFLAGAQYATLLFSVFTPSIISLIVIERLGAVANAHYYITALITSGLMLLNLSIERSFLVEAASEPDALRHNANVALAAMATVLIPGVLIGLIFAPELLRIFGAEYAAKGTTLLRLLLLSVPLSTLSIFYSSFAWLDKKVWWMAARDLVSVLIYFAVVLPLMGRFGINAIGIGTLCRRGFSRYSFFPSRFAAIA